MDAIETLAAVTDVCSDKTGTITLGKMVMQRAWIPARLSKLDSDAKVTVDTSVGQMYTIETGSDPYYPRGRVMAIGPDEAGDAFGDDDSDDEDRSDDLVDKDSVEPPLRDLVLCAALCNSATIQRSSEEKAEGSKGKWEAHGDATEVALQTVSIGKLSKRRLAALLTCSNSQFAYKLGHGRPHLTHRPDLNRQNTAESSDLRKVPKTKTTGHYEQIVEHPFDSGIKRMTVAYTYHAAQDAKEGAEEPHVLVVMKGAFERVFERCSEIIFGDVTAKITEQHKKEIMHHYDALAGQGLRVLTLCGKKMPMNSRGEIAEMDRDDLERDMAFLGLAGI